MIGEWIRFVLSAVCILGGLVTLIIALIGLLRFDFALNRIHAAAMADTLALLLFMVGVMLACGWSAVVWKLGLVLLLQWVTAPLVSHMLAKLEYRADRNLGEHMELPAENEEVRA